MSPDPQKPNRDEWRDRLVDRALEERLGGDVPPDLSAKTLAAAAAAGSSTGDVTMATATAKRSWGARNWVLAASVLVNVGLIAVLLASRTQPFYTMAAKEADNENRSATESAPAVFDNQETPSTSSSGPAPAAESASESSANGSQITTDAYEISPDDVGRTVTYDGQETSQFEWSAQDRSGGGEQAEGQQGQGQAAPLADELSSLDLRAKTESKVNLNATPGGGRGSSGQNQATDGGAAAVDDMGLAEFGGRGVPSRQNGFESFYEVELGAAPVEGAPVVYPDKQTWDELTRRRAAGAETAPREEALDAADPSSLRFGRAASELGRGDGSEDAVVSGRRQLTEKRQYTRIAGTYSYDYGADRATWGYAGTNWREWPPGEAVQWQGSPDGEGIGPGAAGDQYERIHENRFIPSIGEEAVSTFSIDVDTASYANVRQMLMNGQVPPPDAVRLEEMVNYFDYNYEPPTADERRREDPFGPKTEEPEVPFAAHVETAGCPWQPGHRLVRIGIKGREIPAEKRPLSNLVFLVDVSGSMNNPDKLPLVKHGLTKLAEKLGENDRVAIVVYASSEGLALPSTPGTEQETILAALENLQAGGSTAGGAGIKLAYQIAEDNFITGGTNRVILCTDGDFNVGVTNTAELERMVEQKAKDTGVFLSCIGFGRGNLNDAMMEKITEIGNGNYYYADDQREAERIFVKGMTGMLVTIAKDVKMQVEFNPAKVLGYRLLGYENRMLKTEDFNDDEKDAGEIGAGHTVTCLYEIVPVGEKFEEPNVDDLKYQHPAGLTDAAETEEMLTLKMRYKQPDEDTSSKLEWPVTDSGHRFGEASTDMQFAAAVASFGMLLRDSQYKGDATYDAVAEIAGSARGDDPEGDRAEFVELVRKAKQVMPAPSEPEAEAATDTAPAEEAVEENGE